LRSRRSIAVLLLCLGALFAMPVALASADTGDIIEPQNEPPSAADGWQAGTCTSDTPTQCSPETPGQFYEEAGGHPPVGFTQYIIQHEVLVPGTLEPIVTPLEGRDIKTLRVDLPPGLTVNPEATASKCSISEFLNSPAEGVIVPTCAADTQTGEEQASLVVNKAGFELSPGVPLPLGYRLPLIPGLFAVPVYNLKPNEDPFAVNEHEPALFGFVIADKEPVFLETEVEWEGDFHESFTVRFLAESEDAGIQTLISRLLNFGDSGNGTFISNPTTCFDPEAAATEHLYSTFFRAESFENPNAGFPNGSTAFEAPLPEGVAQENCAEVPFDPTIGVEPGTTAVDSPSKATVTTEIPFENPEEGGGELSQSHLRKASVTLPVGMGLNPSGSVGLVACSDADFKKGVRTYENTCPADSQIGTAEIETPVLEEGLKGKIYVGEQQSSNPESGKEFRVLVEAKSERLGIDVRLEGETVANQYTGQLTTKFTDKFISSLSGEVEPEGLPQVPFESVVLKFDGPHSVLTSPPTCSASEVTSVMEPWSTPASTKKPGDEFTLTTEPGGGTCPKTLAERKFAPSYDTKSDSTQGGAYAPFRVHIGRPDGQQELKVVNVTLPKGLTGKLAGIPYCDAAAILAAESKSGKSEQASPSCSSASEVGNAIVASGTGDNPVKLGGKVYLSGPYKGAPLSLAVITPAVSGPFDLGTVVVRIALNVNPLTAQINAVSDTIPDVFGGVKLDIRAIDFNIDRKEFTINPTNCSAQATTGSINGGGGDPTNAAAWSSYAVNTAFTTTGCNTLKFKPKLRTQLFGPTTRAKNPRIKAILEARKGDANIGRTALTLPHSLFLDQSHIGTVCTNPKLASHTCPANSVYGSAEAVTPLLEKPLKGPVYLVPSGNELPDLVADLRGQVEIQLHGVISSQRGGLKTVFNAVPDVPVKKFTLNMKGGKKSLLVNSTNTCKGPQYAVLKFKGQNNKVVTKKRYRLNITTCSRRAKKHKQHK
jgi:hypothetical protein